MAPELDTLVGVPPALAVLPPEPLRRRTQGVNTDPQAFIDIGRRCRDDLRAALQEVGADWDQFSSVLDFGCGCGRTLVWMAGQSPEWRLHGTDIDSEAIAWCQTYLPFATFDVNDGLPPLRYADGSFDLVYAIAVFTHLQRQRAWAWLNELRRVTTSGGLVLLTVFGQHCADTLSPENQSRLRDTGTVFVSRPDWKGLYPDWFGLAYHTEAHVRDTYGQLFDVLAYRPCGLNDHLDVIVCRKA